MKVVFQSKIVVQVHFKGDFVKNILLVPGLEPWVFLVVTFLRGICIYPINYFQNSSFKSFSDKIVNNSFRRKVADLCDFRGMVSDV